MTESSIDADAAGIRPGLGVTGAGDLRGTAADEALRIVAGELGSVPHLAFLPWFPERGPGGDAVGRTAALLTDVSEQFAVSTTPAGWRIAGAESREMRRARSWIGEDLDAAEQHLEGYTRDLVLPVVGPWTMAASVELVTGHRAIRDHGAVRDLIGALGEAYAMHAAEVARRIPGCRPILRIDEPQLEAALVGGLATPSGLDRYRAVERVRAGDALAAVVRASGVPCMVRCARGSLPLAVMRASGAAGFSMDLAAIDLARDAEHLGEMVDADAAVFLGVSVSDSAATVDRVTRLWTSLGFDPELMAATLALQPAVGMPLDPVAECEVLRAASARMRDVREEEIR